jgi:multimeric flavodoxin WrbA
MAIIAVCGGLRKESNTNKLVKKVAEASGYDCEIIELAGVDIKPCTGCGECIMNEGSCIIKDGMQPIYDKLMKADGLIIGSPTYYMDISGAIKCFIDRSMPIFYRNLGPEYNPNMPWLGKRPLAGKPAVTVTTVAGGGHERTRETLKIFVDDINHMALVAEVAEAIGMNDVDDMPEVMKRAAEAGMKLGKVFKRAC